MDSDHAYVQRRRESTFGEKDTGVKLAIFYVPWAEPSKSSSQDKAQLNLYLQENLANGSAEAVA
jgi:hypothetical protein